MGRSTDRIFFRAAALGMPLALSACGLLFAISDDAASGSRDAGGGDATPVGETGAADAGITCPRDKPGPAMVSAEKFCIDRTEVTAEQYAAFLAADKGGLALPAECMHGTDFDAALVAPSPNHPVLVEWCAAYAYCAWAGKRLCGAFDGGALLVTSSGTDALQKAGQNEWLWACEGGEHAYTYPYGYEFDRDACAPSQAGSPGERPSYYGLTAVGTHPECVGGYPGVFDMSGNATEWIDARLIDATWTDGGTAFYAMNQTLECRNSASPLSPHTMSTAQQGYGFRCCFSP